MSVSLLCGIPTSAERFEASLPLLSARGFTCWLLAARLSFHAPSQARHWLKIRTIMFWTLRCCDISWNICSRLLLCRTGLLRELFVPVVKGTRPPAVGYALSSWVLGSQSLAVCSWVLGSQSLAVSLSSRPFGTCFIQPSLVTSSDVNLHMFHHRFWSSTTFIDFNVPFRITDAHQSIKISSIHHKLLERTQASPDNKNHHFPRISGYPLLCQRSEAAAPFRWFHHAVIYNIQR